MEINGDTKIYGVFGYPIAHTLSPLLHNTAFKALGLNCVYLPFEVRPENLRSAVRSLKALNIQGVNVTIPHKSKIISYLDEISEEAKIIGAINTVAREGEQLKGYNTDGKGFLAALKETTGEDPGGKSMLVIGAGGGACGVAIQLALEGARKITIANRTVSKAKDLVWRINTYTKGCQAYALSLEKREIERKLKGLDILINATPLGMHPDDPLPVDLESIPSSLIVCDLIYNQPETPLLRLARQNGARTMNGIGMLIHQGALAFELWMGCKAPLEVMRQAVERHLKIS